MLGQLHIGLRSLIISTRNNFWWNYKTCTPIVLRTWHRHIQWSWHDTERLLAGVKMKWWHYKTKIRTSTYFKLLQPLLLPIIVRKCTNVSRLESLQTSFQAFREHSSYTSIFLQCQGINATAPRRIYRHDHHNWSYSSWPRVVSQSPSQN